MCRDCVVFIASSNRCVIHSAGDHIAAQGKCDYFKRGEATGKQQHLTNGRRTIEVKGLKPLGLVTKAESGYVNNAAEAKQ